MDLFAKAKEIKTKVNIWDLIKLKSFAQQSKPLDKMKIKPTKWEKKICKLYDCKWLI